jgi:hypothetical protein
MSINLLNRNDLKILQRYVYYVIIIFSLYFITSSTSVFLLVSGVIASGLFGWVMLVEYKSSDIKITPLLVISILPFFMLGISAIYKSFIYSIDNYEMLGQNHVSTISIVIAYLMVAIGLLFQILGIQLFRPRIKTAHIKKLEVKDVRLINYFIFFVIVSQLSSKIVELGIIQNFLYQIPLAILVFISIKDKDNLLTSYRYKRNFILLGSGLLFLINLTSLSKTTLIYSIIPILLFYLVQSSINKKSRILIMIVILLLSSLYFLFVQPLVSNARLYSKIYKVEVTPKLLADFILSGDYNITLATTDIDKNPIEIFLNRMFELNAPAYIYEQTEKTGYLDGKSFQSITYGLVPRIIWPSKPSIPQGEEFSYKVSGMLNVYVGMLISGELYWNYGYIGIIIGSLIIGLLTGLLWNKLKRFIDTDFIYFTLYLYLLQSTLTGSEFSSVFIGLIQLIIIFYVIRFIKTLIKVIKS